MKICKLSFRPAFLTERHTILKSRGYQVISVLSDDGAIRSTWRIRESESWWSGTCI